MNHIVLDTEFNGRKYFSVNPMETFQIGAIKVNDQGEIVERFNHYIRINNSLTKFVIDFCDINPEDIYRIGEPFVDVIVKFKKFIGKEYRFYTWGKEEQTRLFFDCRLNKVNTKWITNFVDLTFFYTGSLKNTLSKEGIARYGKSHNAFYDAENTAQIFIKYFNHLKNLPSDSVDKEKIFYKNMRKIAMRYITKELEYGELPTWSGYKVSKEYLLAYKLLNIKKKETVVIEKEFYQLLSTELIKPSKNFIDRMG
jgi:inhibitor of KinA sporulation pathway (predicted exonuclease)